MTVGGELPYAPAAAADGSWGPRLASCVSASFLPLWNGLSFAMLGARGSFGKLDMLGIAGQERPLWQPVTPVKRIAERVAQENVARIARVPFVLGREGERPAGGRHPCRRRAPSASHAASADVLFPEDVDNQRSPANMDRATTLRAGRSFMNLRVFRPSAAAKPEGPLHPLHLPWPAKWGRDYRGSHGRVNGSLAPKNPAGVSRACDHAEERKQPARDSPPAGG